MHRLNYPRKRTHLFTWVMWSSKQKHVFKSVSISTSRFKEKRARMNFSMNFNTTVRSNYPLSNIGRNVTCTRYIRNSITATANWKFHWYLLEFEKISTTVELVIEIRNLFISEQNRNVWECLFNKCTLFQRRHATSSSWAQSFPVKIQKKTVLLFDFECAPSELVPFDTVHCLSQNFREQRSVLLTNVPPVVPLIR